MEEVHLGGDGDGDGGDGGDGDDGDDINLCLI